MGAEIYIKVNKSNMVTSIHHNPFDPVEGLNTPRSELEKEGFFISSIPKAEVLQGRRAVPKFNQETKEVYYEYVPVPLSTEERIGAMEDMMNELLLGGGIGGGL